MRSFGYQTYPQITPRTVAAHLVLAAALAFPLACQVPGSEKMQAFRQSERLTAQDAEALEQRLLEDPGDVPTRTLLLFYYGRSFAEPSAAARRGVHTLWLIENAPEAEILTTAHARLTQFDWAPFASTEARDALYAPMEAAWIRQIEAHPDSPAVIRNAARFSWLSDPERPFALLERGAALEPANPEWREKMGHELNDRAWEAHDPPDAGISAQALVQFERARELSESEGWLVELARTAFDAGATAKARRYAEAAIAASRDRYYPQDYETHYGNIVLGRIALREGNPEEARERLLAAAELDGGPVVDRPNMALARDLLEEGESTVVLEYFKRCTDFWPRGKERLSAWAAEVEAGEIPDFGSYLRF